MKLLKTLLVALLLVVGQVAFAEDSCQVTLQGMVNQFAVQASKIAGGTRISPKVVMIESKYDAFAVTSDNTIEVSTKVCGRSEIQVQYVVMHELGHYVAYKLYPDLYRSKNTPKAVHEAMADRYARSIAELAGNYAPLLSWLETACAAYPPPDQTGFVKMDQSYMSCTRINHMQAPL